MAKYTYDFKHKIERERKKERKRERESKTWPSSLHSAEACSEPFPTSKQGGYLIWAIFTKISILDVWKGSEYVVA